MFVIVHHRDTETRRTILEKALTEQIIGAAIEVHRHLGPGLLESAYEECLCHELNLRGLNFERQRPLPLEYKCIKPVLKDGIKRLIL
ncbi:MAG: GxxExxY protein [bacterium]